MEDLPEISDEELRRRVFYSCVRAAGRLARMFELPLKEARSWLEVAYYHVLSDEGLSQGEVAELFGVSKRKVVQLASDLKENFFRPEQEGGLPRRIEFMLWAGEMSEGRIRQSLDGVSDEEVDRALDRLVEEDRVVRRPGRTTYYEVPREEFRLYRDDWIARIDGLNNHLSNVVDGIYARFFDDSDRAFARTVNFRCRPEDIEELRELYEEEVFPKLREMELEAKAEEDRGEGEGEAEAVQMGLSINWAPHRYCEKELEDEE